MQYYGKSKEVCESILEKFQSGDIPQALSQVFVKRNDDTPSAKWSWNNQFIQAIMGTSDARGFNQWQQVGRKVKKGSKSIHILGPCFVKKTERNETGEVKEYQMLVGFRSIPVFRIEDTEVHDEKIWSKFSALDNEEENRIASLPFIDVAKQWWLSVQSFSGNGSKYLGYYKHGQAIALGTKNLSTWAHELIHAADDKNGKITKAPGQQQDNEVVAELGGAALLKIAGLEYEADLGGCWECIKSYCKNDSDKTISYCFKMINRICEAISLVLSTAEKQNESNQSIAA